MERGTEGGCIRLCIVWDWTPDHEQSFQWCDGLAAAVRELSTRHEVKMFCPGETPSIIPNPYIPIHVVENVPYQVAQFRPDAVLIWADGTRPNIAPLQASGVPCYLLFTGGDCNLPSFAGFKHVFVENTSYLDVFKAKGISTSIAFGTNTELYAPIPEQPKVIDYLFPATFALWKRHKLFAEALAPLPGVKVACGFIQPQLEAECWEDCQKAGIAVLPHISGKALHRLYAASKSVIITSMSIGGSQRTVLEAMAMNIPLVVNGQSEKTTEYLKDGGFGIIVDPTAEAIREGIAQIKPVNTRDYVLSKWSHLCYARAIEDVICA